MSFIVACVSLQILCIVLEVQLKVSKRVEAESEEKTRQDNIYCVIPTPATST